MSDNWQDLANCRIEPPNKDLLTDDEYEKAYDAYVNDVSFIYKPDEVTARRWARICSRCEVIEECFRDHEQRGATGVFAAGEWLDDDEGLSDMEWEGISPLSSPPGRTVLH